MPPTIEPITPDRLIDYARVPMVCDVRAVLTLDDTVAPLAGFPFRQTLADPPYQKNYDADPQSGPLSWAYWFDLSNWAFWLACEHGQVAGGACVAWNTPGLDLLLGRKDIAVLWDIRVHPSQHRKGLGKALFHTAAQWARSKDCRALRVETQNVNIPACRFYASMGCTLSAIDRHAYAHRPAIAHEIMLMWQLDLTR